MDKWARLSWFHTPLRRGFTHLTIVVSHTKARGITHPPVAGERGKQPFLRSFSKLNFFNSISNRIL